MFSWKVWERFVYRQTSVPEWRWRFKVWSILKQVTPHLCILQQDFTYLTFYKDNDEHDKIMFECISICEHLSLLKQTSWKSLFYYHCKMSGYYFLKLLVLPQHQSQGVHFTWHVYQWMRHILHMIISSIKSSDVTGSIITVRCANVVFFIMVYKSNPMWIYLHKWRFPAFIFIRSYNNLIWMETLQWCNTNSQNMFLRSKQNNYLIKSIITIRYWACFVP